MKFFFRALLNLGISSELSVHDQRRVKIINLLNFVVLFFLLIGLSNYFLLENSFPIIPELIFISIAAAALYFSYIKKTQTSFLLFTLNANISIFFVNQYYPFESGSYLYYFPAIVTIILLNNVSSRNWLAMLHFSISALFFLLFLVLDIPEWQLKGLSQETLKVLWNYNIIMTALITAMVSGLLNRLIAIQNAEILKQNNVLNKAKEEINVSLKEKEVLLAELHHRVKNNLAIISGLLSLQSENAQNTETKQIITDSRNRIQSMALVHKMLYRHPQLENIDIGIYSNELIKELLKSFDLNGKVLVKEGYDLISLPVNKSIPLGLILNEIITNSIKYVFKAELLEEARLEVSIRHKEGQVVLMAKDSGPGFPRDMNTTDQSFSLGIFLVKSLAEQLDGSVHFSNENGAKVELSFVLN